MSHAGAKRRCCALARGSGFAETTIENMKYYLLQRGDSADENTLHAFDTPAERDDATIKAIFGEDLTTQDEAEAWDKYREELTERGHITSEGDPGLEWFTAHPAASCPNDGTEARGN